MKHARHLDQSGVAWTLGALVAVCLGCATAPVTPTNADLAHNGAAAGEALYERYSVRPGDGPLEVRVDGHTLPTWTYLASTVLPEPSAQNSRLTGYLATQPDARAALALGRLGSLVAVYGHMALSFGLVGVFMLANLGMVYGLLTLGVLQMGGAPGLGAGVFDPQQGGLVSVWLWLSLGGMVVGSVLGLATHAALRVATVAWLDFSQRRAIQAFNEDLRRRISANAMNHAEAPPPPPAGHP